MRRSVRRVRVTDALAARHRAELKSAPESNVTSRRPGTQCYYHSRLVHLRRPVMIRMIPAMAKMSFSYFHWSWKRAPVCTVYQTNAHGMYSSAGRVCSRTPRGFPSGPITKIFSPRWNIIVPLGPSVISFAITAPCESSREVVREFCTGS